MLRDIRVFLKGHRVEEVILVYEYSNIPFLGDDCAPFPTWAILPCPTLVFIYEGTTVASSGSWFIPDYTNPSFFATIFAGVPNKPIFRRSLGVA
jgi:hypothetical protein